jgi:hypothetical protein
MAETRWYKGNIHTHTNRSDGDADPETVVKWYRDHGYDFLVLSDHNHLTILDYASSVPGQPTPLMVPGEEVTVNMRRNGTLLPVHLNGIGISRFVEPTDTGEVVSTIQANINAILDAGGIACINHPNRYWAFDHKAINQTQGAGLLEVFNGEQASNDAGAPGRFSPGQIWDGVLSAGQRIFGVAVDDSHYFHDFAPHRSNPGRGWVVVRSAVLESEAIVEALASGDFYSSTGVSLSQLEVSADRLAIKIEQQRDYIYTTRFTGKCGKLLSEVVGTEAIYEVKGDEQYVRATIASSAGTRAWIQPVFTC